MNMLNEWSQVVKNRSWHVNESLSPGQTNRMLDLLNGVLGKSTKHLSNSLHKGFHFMYILQKNNLLGSDGYDNEQAPTVANQSIFKRRMWVRGSIEFHNLLSEGSFECVECVKSVRPIHDSVLVTIQKEITQGKPILTETRSLMYTNSPYLPKEKTLQNDTTEQSKSPDSLQINVKLTPTDLLKYSMLTNNLHKIHYDKQFAISENFPDLVVHGPFMVSLVLYWFSGYHNIRSFKYKNMEPCFVGEDMIIECGRNGDVFEISIRNTQGKRYLEGFIRTESSA